MAAQRRAYNYQQIAETQDRAAGRTLVRSMARVGMGDVIHVNPASDITLGGPYGGPNSLYPEGVPGMVQMPIPNTNKWDLSNAMMAGPGPDTFTVVPDGQIPWGLLALVGLGVMLLNSGPSRYGR